jgi:hypothetical protein
MPEAPPYEIARRFLTLPELSIQASDLRQSGENPTQCGDLQS